MDSYTIHNFHGGVSEGTKVGFPNEYDYLVFVEGLEDQLLVVDDENPGEIGTKLGYVTLKFNEENTTSGDGAGAVLEELSTGYNGHFDVNKFNDYFRVLAHTSFSSVVKDDTFYFRLGKPQRSFALAAITFTLDYPSNEFGDIEITIDVVPVIKLPPGWQPKHFRDGLILQSQDRFCATLMKPANDDPTGKCIVVLNDQLRISTSLVETRIIQQMPTRIKEAFIALKAINEFDDSVLQVNSTYVIKMAAIRYAMESTDNVDNGSDEKVILEAMIAIISCFRHEFLS